MEVYQQRIACKVIVDGVGTEVGIGNGGTRHVNKIDDLLKVWGRKIGGDVVNGESWMGGRKAKHTAYLTKKSTHHMTNNRIT